MYWIDPEDAPTAAEAERDAPTPREIAVAIASQGPAPCTPEDFGPVSDDDRPF